MRSKKKIFFDNLTKEDKPLAMQEKKHGGIGSPHLCAELDGAQHRLHAYAT